MYKNIANFLKESPEWIENWLNTPVKAKYIQNPLMIPEVIANVLNYLPLRYCKEVCKLWDREIDFALYDLHRKQESLVKKYWDSVVECEKLVTNLMLIMINLEIQIHLILMHYTRNLWIYVIKKEKSFLIR